MIVLLGGSGYVGQAFQRLFTRRNLPYRSLARRELDYTRPEVLAPFLREVRPDFLVNAAGYTGKPNVDACELHKAECLDGNAVLPGRIAEACAAAGVPWGHVSSGCIYSGTRADGTGFREDDPPNFSFRSNHCSFYSGTKALGEELLADRPDVYIWRVRIPFNEVDHPRNYLTKLMRYDTLLEAANSLSQLDEFAAGAVACWERRVPFGLYNFTNPGHLTTREVVALIRRRGVCRKEFRFFASEAEFLHRAARTPRSNCILNTDKLAATGIRLAEVHEAVDAALLRWQRSS